MESHRLGRDALRQCAAASRFQHHRLPLQVDVRLRRGRPSDPGPAGKQHRDGAGVGDDLGSHPDRENQAYQVACSATPSGNATLLRAKLWRSGSAEPASWQVTGTDSAAALQVAGGIGISSYLSSSATAGVTLSVDDLVATNP